MPKVGGRRVVWLDDQHEIGMTFCWIPPGEFRMGSRNGDSDEQPVHRVVFEDGFWLGQTPITQRQYAVRFPDHQNGFPGRDEHPAESMTWHDARRYCQWLHEHRLDDPGWVADLPTEARWEYACRAGTDTDYHTGDGEQSLRWAGWNFENSGGSTHQVVRKTPNSFGLYDTHGNVFEWCRDVWSQEAYRLRADGRSEFGMPGKPVAEVDERARVFRGGSWGNSLSYCRSAYRDGDHPDGGSHVLGFRVGLFPGSSCKSVRGVRIQTELGSKNGPDEAAPDRAVPNDA